MGLKFRLKALDKLITNMFILMGSECIFEELDPKIR